MVLVAPSTTLCIGLPDSLRKASVALAESWIPSSPPAAAVTVDGPAMFTASLPLLVSSLKLPFSTTSSTPPLPVMNWLAPVSPCSEFSPAPVAASSAPLGLLLMIVAWMLSVATTTDRPVRSVT